jgi:hypothetical protein
MVKTYFKLAQPNGFDFYSGKTINYREAIGKTVSVPEASRHLPTTLCSSTVIHACPNPNDCFVGAKIPCSVYVVEGRPVVDDDKKFGFRRLKVIEEITSEKLDELFGWKYSEAANPIHPFKIKPPATIGEEQIRLLQTWASVGASVGESVWDSVGASVGASVRASVWASVWNSVYAYIGSLFPKIRKWKYIEHEEGVYPFQSAVDLWRQGLIASFDGKVWRLHGGEKAAILYEMKAKEAP